MKHTHQSTFYDEMVSVIAILSIPLSLIIFGGKYLYEEYFAPDPIDELFCYCKLNEAEYHLAKIYYRAEDAQRAHWKLVKGQFDYGLGDRIPFGERVLVYRYYGNPSVAKVEWVHKPSNYVESGWTPAICLQDTLDTQLRLISSLD